MTATSEPEVPSGPSSRIGIECDDLLSDTAATAAIPGSLPRTEQAADLAFVDYHVFEIFPIKQLGGLVCDWTPLRAISGQTGSFNDYTGIHVEVMPDATTAWSNYLARTESPDELWYCFNYEPIPFCNFETLVGTNWTSIQISGYPGSSSASDEQYAAEVRPFVDGIVAVIADTTTTGEPWTDPAASPPPGSCEALIPVTVVAEATGVDGLAAYPAPSTSFGLLRTASRAAVGELDCFMQYGGDSGIGTFTVLPSGGWALKEMITIDSKSGPAEEVEVAGLADDDGAWLRCLATGESCIVDLLVSGNWVQILLWTPTSEEPYFPADPREAVLTLAAAAVARLG